MGACKSGKLSFLLAMAVILTCSFTSSLAAAPDPSIKDWGSPPGNPPPYQTGDIWVDNNGNGIPNEVGEPSKGIKNRLFAKVRNLGASEASNVTVRFAYAPFGAWGWASYADFKEIVAVTGVTLTSAGTANAEKVIEVEWDLRDLTENNGGKWGGHTVGEFDHFCVWVKVELTGDANTGNNDARNNFTNVQTAIGIPYSLKFLAANPKKAPAQGELIIKGIPEDWRVEVKGVPEYQKFELGPREFKLLTLTMVPAVPRLRPAVAAAEPAKYLADVTLKIDGEAVGGISFAASLAAPPAAFSPSGGMVSPYLIGTFDSREGARTILHIINPTANNLRVMVLFLDDNEKPLKCLHERLTPNDLLEINVTKLNLPAALGVIKVVALDPREDVPVTGIVGFQRHFFKGRGVTEAPLHGIPLEILKEDLKYIWKACK